MPASPSATLHEQPAVSIDVLRPVNATEAGTGLVLFVLRGNPAKRLYASLGFSDRGRDRHRGIHAVGAVPL
jgi:hypothetical protein